jgi:hypothetical protein
MAAAAVAAVCASQCSGFVVKDAHHSCRGSQTRQVQSASAVCTHTRNVCGFVG